MDLPIWLVVLILLRALLVLLIAYMLLASCRDVQFPRAGKWLMGIPLWMRESFKAMTRRTRV
jgi:hypothetical protein